MTASVPELPRDAAHDGLDRGDAGQVDRGQAGDEHGVDERAPHDQVDVEQAVAQDRDPDRGRDQAEAHERDALRHQQPPGGVRRRRIGDDGDQLDDGVGDGHEAGRGREPLDLPAGVPAGAPEAHDQRRRRRHHEERHEDDRELGVVDDRAQGGHPVGVRRRRVAGLRHLARRQHLRQHADDDRGPAQPRDRPPARSGEAAVGEEQQQERPGQHDRDDPERRADGGDRRRRRDVMVQLERVVGVRRRVRDPPADADREQEPADPVPRPAGRDEEADDREREHRDHEERGRQDAAARPARVAAREAAAEPTEPDRDGEEGGADREGGPRGDHGQARTRVGMLRHGRKCHVETVPESLRNPAVTGIPLRVRVMLDTCTRSGSHFSARR